MVIGSVDYLWLRDQVYLEAVALLLSNEASVAGDRKSVV